MDESYPQYDPDLDLLTCRFSRQIITSYEVSPSSSRGNRPVEIDLLRGKYYVFLAVGGLQGMHYAPHTGKIFLQLKICCFILV